MNKFEFFWATNKMLKVNGEEMTPEEAYQKYPEHAQVLQDFVINSQNKTVRKNIESQRQVHKGSEEFYKFKKIYSKLINELQFDQEYADEQKRIDAMLGLKALDIKNKDIERTKTDKKGVCTTFSMRLNYELDKLNIPNWIVCFYEKNSVNPHFANLYIMDDKFYIADMTKDIVYGNMMKESNLLEVIPPVSCQLNLNEYFANSVSMPLCFNIIDNIPMNEIPVQPIDMLILNYTQLIQDMKTDSVQFQK